MPNVVRVFAVIQGVKGSMRLGITTDDQLVVVAREVMQCTRGVHKTSACHALAGIHIADRGILYTACWPGATKAQATCDVRHIATLLEWALGTYQGGSGLKDPERDALVADVRAQSMQYAQQRISSVCGKMAVSMGLAIEQVDPQLEVLCKTLEAKVNALHAKLPAAHEDQALRGEAPSDMASTQMQDVRMAGDDVNEGDGRERDAGVVGGRGGLERDASSELSGDRVGVGDGARGEHGACDAHVTDSGGAHGVRGDGVGVGDIGEVPGVGADGWQCLDCTLLNDDKLLCCFVCNAE